MRTDTEGLCQVSQVPKRVDREDDVGGRVRSSTRDGAVTGKVGSEMEQPGSCGGALGREATLLHGVCLWVVGP